MDGESEVDERKVEWPYIGYSESSLICSDHFEASAYQDELYSQFNLKRLRLLKPNAVPIIKSTIAPHGKAIVKKRSARTAAEKRKKMRILEELLAEPSQEPQDVSESENPPSADDTSSVASPSDLYDEQECSHWTAENPLETLSSGPIVTQQVKDSSVDVKQQPLTQSVGTQTSRPTRVKRTQITVQSCDKGCQIRPDPPLVSSRGTTYDIKDVDVEDDTSSDNDTSPETESDEPSQCRPESPGYIPEGSSSDDKSTPQKPRKRLTKRKSGQSPRTTWEVKDPDIPPHEETKFIVFETKLMELFQKCPDCHSGNVHIQKRVVGTLVTITRECLTCNGVSTTWESQPWYGNAPAGNVLLSAATLFAGGSCSKTLRILQNLRVATISERTFYRHQEHILQPTIEHQWQLSQEAIIAELMERGIPSSSPSFLDQFPFCLI